MESAPSDPNLISGFRLSNFLTKSLASGYIRLENLSFASFMLLKSFSLLGLKNGGIPAKSS